MDRAQVQRALDAGGGVLRLEPSWVPLTVQNLSATDPLVMLKHFGPGNPDGTSLIG